MFSVLKILIVNLRVPALIINSLYIINELMDLEKEANPEIEKHFTYKIRDWIKRVYHGLKDKILKDKVLHILKKSQKIA